MPFNLVVS